MNYRQFSFIYGYILFSFSFPGVSSVVCGATIFAGLRRGPRGCFRSEWGSVAVPRANPFLAQPSTPSTRLNRSPALFFKSSRWPDRESNPLYKVLVACAQPTVPLSSSDHYRPASYNGRKRKNEPKNQKQMWHTISRSQHVYNCSRLFRFSALGHMYTLGPRWNMSFPKWVKRLL